MAKNIKVAPKISPLDILLKRAVAKKKIIKSKLDQNPIVKPKVKKVVKPANPAKQPQVYKKTELEWMIDLIKRGLWRSTNLAEIIGINRETVDNWKKLPEVIEERRKVVWKTLGSNGKGRGVEMILKEMGVETDPDKLEVIHKFEDLKDDELDDRIASKARQVGVVGVTSGEGATTNALPSQVRSTAPKAN